MRFQTRFDNFVMVVRPKTMLFNPAGLLISQDRGLRAEFIGPLHIFDSEASARSYHWTDEDRITVEKWLLTSPQFGVDINLAFDQTVPSYLDEWLEEKGISLGPNFDRRCGKVWADGEDIKQCSNKAVPGKDFCGSHLPKAATQGISSTVTSAG